MYHGASPNFVEQPPMTTEARLITMARYLARKAIRDHLRANGIRTLELEPAELRRATDIYLEVRRAELIVEARAILCR